MAISDYSIEALLSAGRSTLVYRAIRVRDGRRVILKALRPECRRHEARAQLRSEYELLSRFDDPALPGALAIESSAEEDLLIMEDAGGRSLEDVLRERHKLEVGEALAVGCEVARALSIVHREGIIHRDVTPANIIVSGSSGTSVLVDFGLAVVLGEHEESIPASGNFVGTAAYVPPEQTGRVRRPTDPRADLYGLGATLYETLAGHPPFQSEDVGELLHAHLAIEPRLLDEVAPRVPRAVAQIVKRLLSKEPDLRFRSAAGLGAALEACRQGWLAGDLDSRELSCVDEDEGRLPLRPKLVGREALIGRVRSSLGVIERGTGHLVALHGVSGSGKSRIIEAARELLEMDGTSVAVGKFEQHAELIPYQSLISALRSVLGPAVASWTLEERASLASAIGSMAPLANSSFPELAQLLPSQLRQLDVEFSESAFQGLLRIILGVLATPEHPLVVVLDDAQWIDPASLAFVKAIIVSPASASLAWVLSYRTDEVTGSHPLRSCIDDVKRGCEHYSEIRVSPWTRETTTSFVAEVLGLGGADVVKLGARVYLEAEGNPLFSGFILQGMVDRGELHFDGARRRWRWHESAGASEGRALDSLVAERIRGAQEETLMALQVAALIGSRSSLGVVSAILGSSSEEVAVGLDEVVEAGVAELQSGTGPDAETSIAFLHDRLREAVMVSISPEQRPALHLRIARVLHSLGEGEASDQYSVVRHYEAAGDTLCEPEERREVARVGLRAAAMARRTGAHEAARHFAAFSLQLVGGLSWASDYSLLFAAHLETLDCDYQSGAFELAESSARELLGCAMGALDQARVLVTLTQVHTAQYRYQEAIDAADRGLRLLRAPIPARIVRWKVARDTFLLRARSRRFRTLDDVLGLPRLRDPRLQMILRLVAVSQAAYIFTKPGLLVARAISALNMSIRIGISDLSANLFAVWAPFCAHVYRDIARSRLWLDAAVALSVAEPNPMTEAMNAMNVEVFGRIWYEPVRRVRSRVGDAYKRSLLLGDYPYALFTAQHSLLLDLFEGVDVAGFCERVERVRGLGKTGFRGELTPIFDVMGQLAAALAPAERSRDFVVPAFSEDPQMLSGEHAEVVLYAWLYFRALLATFRRDYRGCERLRSEQLGRLGRALGGSIAPLDFNFYRILFLAETFLDEPRALQKKDEADMERLLQRLRVWGRRCPANFEARFLLAEAEVIRVLRPDRTLAERYLEAHASAKRYGAPHIAGLALELGAQHEIACGRTGAAVTLLRGATEAYAQWGATAVVRRVEAELASYTREHVDLARERSNGRESSSQRNVLDAVDLDAVVRVSQAVASELELAPLLRTLMKALLENSGARRGVIALMSNGSLRVEARATADPPAIHVLESTRLVRARDLPRLLLERVAATREVEILDDASAPSSFPADDFLRGRCPLSMMCLPIEYQGELVGVLYLENDLVRDLFSAERSLFLTQVASQISAALVNARLTDAYRKFVPHEFIDILGKKSVIDVRLGDHALRDMTIMFADIRGFSARSERMSPRESFLFVNTTLEGTGPVVRSHGGFIDKYLGDAIMALFPRSADDAVRAALEMLGNLRRYNESHRGSPDFEDVNVGIGLNSGMLMLGTIGEHGRMDGTVISDAVNLASRVEGITKLHGAGLLLTEFTVERLVDPAAYTLREIDRVRVKGRRQPVTVFEALDVDAAPQRALKVGYGERFAAALARFREGAIEDAQVLFAEIAAENPRDQAVVVYLERCAFLLVQGLPEDWDGAFQLEVK